MSFNLFEDRIGNMNIFILKLANRLVYKTLSRFSEWFSTKLTERDLMKCEFTTKLPDCWGFFFTRRSNTNQSACFFKINIKDLVIESRRQ